MVAFEQSDSSINSTRWVYKSTHLLDFIIIRVELVKLTIRVEILVIRVEIRMTIGETRASCRAI